MVVYALNMWRPTYFISGQVSALYFLRANLIGLWLGPTVLVATTDFVFGNDVAIGRSIALCGIWFAVGAYVLWCGLPQIRRRLAFQLEVLAGSSVPGIPG